LRPNLKKIIRYNSKSRYWLVRVGIKFAYRCRHRNVRFTLRGGPPRRRAVKPATKGQDRALYHRDLCQFLQHGLGLFQVTGVPTLRKPAVNRAEDFARLNGLTFITQETEQAD